MTARELRRFLPLVAIAIAVLIVSVVVMGRNDPDATGEVSVSINKPPEKAAETAAKPSSSPKVTQQSTEKVDGPHDDPVPILMYHVTKTAPAGTPYPDLWVSKEDFQAQMQWLDESGFTGITMAQLFKYWDEGFKLPEKPVVISFDDGYPSHDKVARPTLAMHGWPGTLFLKLGNVDSDESGLTKGMVKKLIDAGWEIGSHTISHPNLTTLGASQLREEITESRKQLADEFDVEVDYFCYPAGRYDDAVVAAVERAGYTGAVTTIDGLATPTKPFELKRVRIGKDDGVSGFAAKMRAAD